MQQLKDALSAIRDCWIKILVRIHRIQSPVSLAATMTRKERAHVKMYPEKMQQKLSQEAFNPTKPKGTQSVLEKPNKRTVSSSRRFHLSKMEFPYNPLRLFK